jgi:UDP-glucose-4-epimerase GalE
MEIIVTGGAGFLGTHLCRALSQAGHQVLVVDLKQNPEFETVIADVRDRAKMVQVIKEAEVVFHLAAFIEVSESVLKPYEYLENNVIGSLNVLEAMKINKIRNFVFSSTAAVYGNPKVIPITEDSRTLPINPYGASKLAMEAILSSYVENFDITGIALRYFNLYGPEEHHVPETHAIPRFIDQIRNDKEVTIWGNGENLRDYIYISDVVSAHLLALELLKNQPNKYHYLNLSTEKPLSVIEVVNTIAQVLNKKPNLKFFPPRPGDPIVLYADAGKIKNELGWEAKVPFLQGITKTIEYFKSL